MKAHDSIPSPSATERKLLSRDLFAKATAKFNPTPQTSSPFLIYACGVGRKYSAKEENEFFTDLISLTKAPSKTNESDSDVSTYWIDVDFSYLSPARYEELCQLLEFHDVTKKDCFVEDTTVTDTKVSLFDHYMFIIVDTLLENDQRQQSTEQESKSSSSHSSPSKCIHCNPLNPKNPKNPKNMQHAEWKTKNFNIVQFAYGTVTLHNQSIPGPGEIFDRITHHHQGIIPNEAWILWASFDVLMMSLVSHIDSVVQMVDAIDQQSVPLDLQTEDLDHSKLLREISVGRKRLGKLRSSLSSKMETLSILTTQKLTVKRQIGQWTIQGVGHHLRAVESEAKWKLARVATASDTLQAAYQNYLAFVSVQAANINNQANSVLKKITMLLAITSPLNLIASIMGMNVYPLTVVTVAEAGEETTYTFFIALLVVMFVSSFSLLVVAKQYRWL